MCDVAVRHASQLFIQRQFDVLYNVVINLETSDQKIQFFTEKGSQRRTILHHVSDLGAPPDLLASILAIFFKCEEIRKAVETRDLPPSGTTVLHLAALNGRLSIVSALLAIGCDPSKKSASGKNAFHYAVQSPVKPVEMLLLLLQKDSRKEVLNAPDLSGSTPLMATLNNRNWRLFTMLTLTILHFLDGDPKSLRPGGQKFLACFPQDEHHKIFEQFLRKFVGYSQKRLVKAPPPPIDNINASNLLKLNHIKHLSQGDLSHQEEVAENHRLVGEARVLNDRVASLEHELVCARLEKGALQSRLKELGQQMGAQQATQDQLEAQSRVLKEEQQLRGELEQQIFGLTQKLAALKPPDRPSTLETGCQTPEWDPVVDPKTAEALECANGQVRTLLFLIFPHLCAKFSQE